MDQKMIDHLFRHFHGKMVSILTRIFGLSQLETIEDAVQDTFVNALRSWRLSMPENPEAWLMKAAKNRAIDLFRQLTAEKKRVLNYDNGLATISIHNLFLDNEIGDSQLRMIFTACHPSLAVKDQIAFALKTISGFSNKEIATALLQKEETVKKRLSRARIYVQKQAIAFEIPRGEHLPSRLSMVLEVLYLIFNEGFHSNRKEILIRKDLCGEAIRLCTMLLKNEYTNAGESYALFALMCFQSARLDSKLNDQQEMVDLKHQDRSKWHYPLIKLGHSAMNKAVETSTVGLYHYEAAIAAEHTKSDNFEATNWTKIAYYYEKLSEFQSESISLLNLAIVQLQRNELEAAYALLERIDEEKLEQRTYLYYGTLAEYHALKDQNEKALKYLEQAIGKVKNDLEKQYLSQRMETLLKKIQT